MRKFSSYGQIDPDLHYHAPRTELIERAYRALRGEDPEKGGHYITVWAPRQSGKSSVMLETAYKLRESGEYEVVLMTLQSAKNVHTQEGILELFVDDLSQKIGRALPSITDWKKLPKLFTSKYFTKPLILIVDEFDALDEGFLNSFVNEFRRIYSERLSQGGTASHEKEYLLHGLALIGVRSVLGIENASGSPFNVQQSLHIPNLTFEEVQGMFHWYEKESGQPIDAEVIERLYKETRGQPGLTCWIGEQLTEHYNEDPSAPITVEQFDEVALWVTRGLPSNNILNILSKARQEPYKETVLEIFQTDEKLDFDFDDPHLNFLYLNGVIDIEKSPDNLYVRFPSPFIQKRLFNYFSRELFQQMGRLVEPFDSLEDVLDEQRLYLPQLLARYQDYLRRNSEWLFKDAPRRKKDLRIHEAVYHFNLFTYLDRFLRAKGARVWPEFPTGNGKIDILLDYHDRRYGIEVKSFSDVADYRNALKQAAGYGKQLDLTEIILLFFIETIDAENRQKYETAYLDKTSGVNVKPVFIETAV